MRGNLSAFGLKFTSKGRQHSIKSIFILFIFPIIFLIQELFSISNYYLHFSILFIFFYIFLGSRLLVIFRFIKEKLIHFSRNQKDSTSILTEKIISSFFLGLMFNVGYNACSYLINNDISRINYFIFAETTIIVSLFFDAIGNPQKDNQINEILSFSGIIVILLIPSLFYFLFSIILSPIPFQQGWDIFRYSGITSDYFRGEVSFNFADNYNRPPGFNFFQLSFLILSKSEFLNLIYLNKMGVFITNGICTIIIFQIIYKLTHSLFSSLVPAFILSTFNARIGLGALYFLPSSFTLLFIAEILNIVCDDVNREPNNESKRILWRRQLFRTILLVILTGFAFIFHYFYSLVAILILFFSLLRLHADKIFNFSSKLLFFGLCLYLILISVLEIQIQSSGIFHFFNSLITDDIPIWSFVESARFLFINPNLLNNPIFGLVLYVLISWKKPKRFRSFFWTIFICLLLLYFLPLKAAYRFTYLIMMLNTIIIGLSLGEILEYLSKKPIILKGISTWKVFIDRSRLVNLILQPKSRRIIKALLLLASLLPLSILAFSPVFGIGSHDFQSEMTIIYHHNRDLGTQTTPEAIQIINQSSLLINTNSFISQNSNISLNLSNSQAYGNCSIFEGYDSDFMQDGLQYHQNHVIYDFPDIYLSKSFQIQENIDFYEILYKDNLNFSQDYSVFRQEFKNQLVLQENSTLEINFKYISNITNDLTDFWYISSDSSDTLSKRYYINSTIASSWTQIQIPLDGFNSLQKIKLVSRANHSISNLSIANFKLINASIESYPGTINTRIVDRNSFFIDLDEKILSFDQFSFSSPDCVLTLNYYESCNLISQDLEFKIIPFNSMSLNYRINSSTETIKSIQFPSILSISWGNESEKVKILQYTIIEGQQSKKITSILILLNDSSTSEDFTAQFISDPPKSIAPIFLLKTNSNLYHLYLIVILGLIMVIFFSYILYSLGIKKNSKRKKTFTALPSIIHLAFGEKPNLIHRQNFYAIAFIIMLLFPIYHIFDESYPRYTINQIEIDDSLHFSSYSPAEYEAAQWIYQSYSPDKYIISSDLAIDLIFRGLIGFETDELYYIRDSSYLKIFQQCSEDGIDSSYFQNINSRANKDILFVLTTRLHKNIQTNSTIERGIVSNSWINATLVEYIGKTTGFRQIYNNSDITIFLITF